jgi:hypothetical protein
MQAAGDRPLAFIATIVTGTATSIATIFRIVP